jgi:hypothetical protein
MNLVPCAAGLRAAAPSSPILAAGTQCSGARKKNLAESATALHGLRKTTIVARERTMEIQKRLWPVRNAA